MLRCITASLHKDISFFEWKERSTTMDAKKKISLLESRLNKLSVRDKENYGARRKVEREIRKLKKEAGMS